MKKFLFLLPLFALSVAACFSCAKKPQVEANQPNVCGDGGCPIPAPTVTPPSNLPDVISKDNWQFTLTGPGWVPASSTDSQIQVVFKNVQQKLMVFLIKEPTTASYPEYVLGTIRDMRGAGVNFTSAKQTQLNGTNFVLVTAGSEGNTLFAWLTVRDGFGYAFTCGGPTNVDAGVAPCQALADTLQIK